MLQKFFLNFCILFSIKIFTNAAPSDGVREEFMGYVANVSQAAAYLYQAHDSAGHTMDTVKIIEDPLANPGYIGVYHTMINDIFHVFFSTSTDLIHWTFQAELEVGASQPYITALSDGGYLVLWEQTNPPKYDGNHIRFNYYANRIGWLKKYRNFKPLCTILNSGNSTKFFDAPQTLSKCAEGTPSIYSAILMPDIDHSVIDVGAHFYDDCVHDRQQRGSLTNFSSWTTTPQPQIDTAIEVWNVTGNIGDRDATTYGDYSFGLFEGEFTFGDWSSWRIYCYDYQIGNAYRIPILTHGGSLSLANPSVTRLKAPNGKEAVLTTLYIFSQGAASGEAGQLIYYSIINDTLPACTDAIEDCINYLTLCNNQAYHNVMCSNCQKSCNLCSSCNN